LRERRTQDYAGHSGGQFLASSSSVTLPACDWAAGVSCELPAWTAWHKPLSRRDARASRAAILLVNNEPHPSDVSFSWAQVAPASLHCRTPLPTHHLPHNSSRLPLHSSQMRRLLAAHPLSSSSPAQQGMLSYKLTRVVGHAHPAGAWTWECERVRGLRRVGAPFARVTGRCDLYGKGSGRAWISVLDNLLVRRSVVSEASRCAPRSTRVNTKLTRGACGLWHCSTALLPYVHRMSDRDYGETVQIHTREFSFLAVMCHQCRVSVCLYGRAWFTVRL
jgi:hypothetical protein